MSLLRWLICWPCGLIAGLLWSGLVLLGGDLLVGGWKIPSGIVIYLAGLWLPSVSFLVSFRIAPRADRFAKWLLLSPYLLMALVCGPTLLVLIFAPHVLGEVASEGGAMSRSLSPRMQLILWNVGFLVSVGMMASEKVSELRPPEESGEAKAFRQAYQRSVRAPDIDERMAAAREALELLPALAPWPFEPPMPDARVARGALTGRLGDCHRQLRHRHPESWSELAVTLHDEAMEILCEDDGDAWAEVLTNASIAHAERLAGDPAQNLERAIELAETALAGIDRTTEPDSWRFAARNLAQFLADRRQGDPSENMERAIGLMQDVVDTHPRGARAWLWAKSVAILGTLYQRRIAGDPVENLERATAHLEEALKALDASKRPHEWASTASSLAQVYSSSMLVERRDNVRRARELLTQAEEIFLSLGDRESWASTQMIFGGLWARSPATDWTQAKARSIEHFERALSVFTAEDYPEDHHRAANNLATARMGRLLVSDPDSIQAAVEQSRRHLERVNRETAPIDWAEARMVLGHRLVARRTRASIEEALECYGDALGLLTRESTPDAWISAQSGLADAYAARREGGYAENMERSIRLQEEVLELVDPRSSPDSWVGLMHNLATSYLERVVGSRADNLERAIALVETALVLRLAYERPDERSELLELLGTCFVDRVRGTPEDNARWAVEALSEARELRNPEASSVAWLRLEQKWMRARMALDSLVEETPRGQGERDGERDEPERPTTESFLAQVREDNAAISKDDHLPTWVESQVYLADMIRRGGPDTDLDWEELLELGQDNERRAIEIYQETLAAIDRRNEPALWAFVCQRISTSYELLHLWLDWRRRATAEDEHDPDTVARGVREARQALDQAVDSLEQALEISQFDPRRALDDYVRLGRLQVSRGDWQRARDAFSAAASASDALLADVEMHRQELENTLRALGRWVELAPYAFLASGQVAEALAAAERAKARLIAKALTLQALDLTAEERQRLVELQDDIAIQEAHLASPLLVHRMPPLERATRCREELRHLVAGAVEPAVDELIDQVTADGSVVVFPFLNMSPGPRETDSHLVVAFRRHGVRRIESRTLDGARAFPAALEREMGDKKARWRRIVQQFRRGELTSKSWSRAVKACGRALHTSFGEPLVELLESCGIEPGARLEILPSGVVGILPLAAATASDGSTLLDRYELSLSPSLRVLAAAKARRVARANGESLAFCSYGRGHGSDPHLEFLGFEADAVTSRFEGRSVERISGSEATKANCLRVLETQSVWHFAAHAVFQDSRPDQSAIKLADRELLTVAELIEARQLARPSLVVLSACETGLYDQEELPNEFIGLPAAFLQAGAGGVVATLWPVHDFLSALVLSKFYELYREGRLPSRTALRGAQRWLRSASTAELSETVERWVDEGRVTADDGTRMAKKIAARDRDLYRAPGPPFADPESWGGFVHYGA